MSHLSCRCTLCTRKLDPCLLQAEHSLDLLLWYVLMFLQVHVAYQTSGCIAVHDHDALRHMDFVHSFEVAGGGISVQKARTLEALQTFIHNKHRGQVRRSG